MRTLPDIADFLEPLDRAITEALIPAITDRAITEAKCKLLALPVRMGGLGLTDRGRVSPKEYEASVSVTGPPVRQIVEQIHQSPDVSEIRTLQQSARKERDACMDERLEQVKTSLSTRTKRVVELAMEKGASNWLTVIPIKDLNVNLNKREFRDAIKLRYDWEITDTPKVCVCGDQFNVDHAMVCQRGGFTIQHHNELRDLEAEMLSMVCNDGETLKRGANRPSDARLDISARGFWERQTTAFFDVRVCHPNAGSYRDLSPKGIYRQQENEKSANMQAE